MGWRCPTETWQKPPLPRGRGLSIGCMPHHTGTRPRATAPVLLSLQHFTGSEGRVWTLTQVGGASYLVNHVIGESG
jgi:hypothetical protein